MKPLFTVKKQGLFTTFQDQGRLGFQRFGVVTSGAMDSFSAQCANLLVGNDRNEACIEITMVGPTLLVEADEVTCSICGANLSPTLNNAPIQPWKSFTMKKGDTLSFGQPVSGVRSYIAVAGGYAVEEVLQSQSFYSKAEIGQPIEQGNTIYGRNPLKRAHLGMRKDIQPQYEKNTVIRVILGPHAQAFTKEALENFFQQSYKLQQGDRMGCRLVGNIPLTHKTSADVASLAIPLGTIQVPTNGQPIIMLADRQTTGGYTQIASVISVDLKVLAQLPPGSSIQFKQISIDEAQHALKKEDKKLAFLSMFTKKFSAE